MHRYLVWFDVSQPVGYEQGSLINPEKEKEWRGQETGETTARQVFLLFYYSSEAVILLMGKGKGRVSDLLELRSGDISS